MTLVLRSIAIIAALSAAAPALAQGSANARPDGISWGSMGAWGSSWRNVFVGRDGKVVISWYYGAPPPVPCEPDKTCPPPLKGIHILRYDIGAAGFDQIRTILGPLERKAARSRGKTCGITDAGNASIGWRIGASDISYALGIACKQAENQWADALDNAAQARLTELQTKATDRTETVE